MVVVTSLRLKRLQKRHHRIIELVRKSRVMRVGIQVQRHRGGISSDEWKRLDAKLLDERARGKLLNHRLEKVTAQIEKEEALLQRSR